MYACEHNGLYLIGELFTVLTDHKPIVTISNPNTGKPLRIERKALRLQGYTFTLHNIKGDQNFLNFEADIPRTLQKLTT